MIALTPLQACSVYSLGAFCRMTVRGVLQIHIAVDQVHFPRGMPLRLEHNLSERFHDPGIN